MTTKRPLPIEQYQVGIICALRHEMTAATATLDERHWPIRVKTNSIPTICAVLCSRKTQRGHYLPPAGVYGTNAAAKVANDMLRRLADCYLD